MHIVLLGHEDIASLYALHRLTRLRPEHRYSVLWSGPMAAREDASPNLDALDAFDRVMFDAFLDTLDESSVFRHAGELAAPNSEAGLGTLKDLDPDLIVSVRYRRILRDAAIAVPTHGVLNLHSGILPAYRGVMVSFWAMLAREPEIGTSLHRIVDAGIDTGPIVAIARQPVDYRRSYLDNVLQLYPRGCQLIADAVDRLDAGDDLATETAPQHEGSYFAAPLEADARRFIDQGLKLMDSETAGRLRSLFERDNPERKTP